MGTWLRRNSSKKKYVFNHDYERMDQILEALFLSQQPDKLKEAFITRICDQASQLLFDEATVKGVLQVSSKWILHGTTTLQVSSGFKLFNTWGSHYMIIFQAFFTPTLVSEMLTRGYGMPANVPLLLREGFRIMRRVGMYMYYEHAAVVQSNVTKFVCGAHERLVVRNVVLLLDEFDECIPSVEREVVNFCLAVLHHLSVGAPSQGGQEIQKLIRYTDEIAKSLGIIWKLHSPLLLTQCLSEIFSIISAPRTEEQSDTAIYLAAVVKHIPIDIANRVVKDIVTDPSVSEKSIGAAVGQIVDWLKWPTAQNVDLWLLCFLTELAAAQKYTLLSRITEAYVEQVVENIAFLYLRHASFRILSHMLLGFQHSPRPFHKCLEKMPSIIQRLRAERTSEDGVFLLQVSQLIYCLMYQHTGFPEVYEPVMELIKDIPQPDAENIKAILNQAKWSSQATCSVVMEAPTPYLSMTSSMIRQEKLEPGKTGLENLGNTCYMNSVLQALYMCDQFRRGVLVKLPQAKENLLVKLQHTFAHLSQSNRPTMTPSKFLQASSPPWFLPGHQQDCSEYLKYLLNQLHEDEKSSCHPGLDKRPSTGSISSTGTIRANVDTLNKTERKKESVMLTAVKMKSEEERSGTRPSESCGPDSGTSSESVKSLVERTFRGKVQTKLKCLACKQESLTVESFVDIPLAFPNSSRSAEYPHKNLAGGGGSPGSGTEAESMQVAEAEHVSPSEESFSLNDLILFYLKPEKLTGENKYHCGKCGKLQDGEKSIQIIETPQYLIFTLLRFSYDTKLQTRTKIFQDVRYPRTISVPVHCRTPFKDVKPCLSNQHSRTSSTSSRSCPDAHLDQLEDIARHLGPKCEDSSCGNQSHLLYSLSGVIIHSGTSSECGHYYCYARHSQSGQVKVELLDNIKGNIDNLDLLPDKWYNFNDSRVSRATFNSFSNVTKKFSKDTAYVLIYRRLDLEGQSSGLGTDPVLRPDLRDAVIRDNEAYLKEQEMEARVQEERRRRRSSSINSVNFHTWNGRHDDDDDDDENPGGGRRGCGDGVDGLDINGSRYVF